MDVTCERCGTEYEFDETLVSDRGTTVKCTNCGHLFKVFRSDPAGASGGNKSWHVELADGTTRTLGSLKELQRLITDGQLSPDDQISRGGEEWKRLGDIAELQTFFASASNTEVDFQPPRPRSTTRPGPGQSAEATRDERARAVTETAPKVSPSQRPPPPPPRQPKGTIIGMGGDPSSGSRPLDGPIPDRRAPPPQRSGQAKTPLAPPKPPPRPPVSEVVPAAADTVQARPVRSEPPPEPVRQARVEPLRSEPAQAVAGPPSGRPLYLEDEEPAAPPRQKSSRAGLWVGLVVLLAVGVGVALGWGKIAPLLGLARAEDPAAPFLEAGDNALEQDSADGYESARTQYTQALAHGQNDPRVLTRLSRAHSLTAQMLLFEATDLEAIAASDPAASGRAQAIRAEVGRHAGTARQRAEDAVRHGSGDPDAQIALADAMRLSNDLPRARSALERALTLSSDPSAESLRVAALLEAAEANGDLSIARAKAEEAVAEDPGMIRTRILLARALLAARDVGAARQQVERVLSRSPQHSQAVALRTAIEEGRPPAPPTVAVPDGGLPDAGVAAAEPQQPAQPVANDPPRPEGGRAGAEPPIQAGGAPPPGRDYSFYIRNADERLERRDLNGARQFYEAARSVRPGGSEALTGLGYVALEQGDASSAADRFRQAAGQGYAEAYIGLGSAYRRMGRLQDALTAYERYLDRLPTGPRAAVARRSADEIRAQLGNNDPPDPPEPNREPAPETDPEDLPPPRGVTEEPPNDTPAIGTED
jgi:predicted Zn finger-like uncharacterized protein